MAARAAHRPLRQGRPGLQFGIDGSLSLLNELLHLLVCQVQLLLVRLLLLLLRLVFRERLLLRWAVLLYLEHKVNNYSPIEKKIFRI